MRSAIFPFKTALNTSTLFPFKLEVTEQVRIAAEAGFGGIELWIQDIDAYLEAGGTLSALRRHLAACDLPVVNAIAFFRWADADDATREAGFAQAERTMRLLAELGCPAVAAPPAGDVAGTTLETMVRHLARLTEMGRHIGVEPYLEFWGRARRLSRLSEALFVASESGLTDVKLLLDPFHMYVGGSPLSSLTYVRGEAIGIVHVNDYPALPAREAIGDADRIFPGEGIAPASTFAQLLYSTGYRGYLSLELFREHYDGLEALVVARHGRETVETAYQVQGQQNDDTEG